MQQYNWQWKTEAPRTLPSLTIGILRVGHIGKKMNVQYLSMAEEHEPSNVYSLHHDANVLHFNLGLILICPF